uniref:MIF4G domain-containing protein n=1 Tax=viral metagenome TaxID=1070528 RepID=A0A6C0JBC5_9ZZZZ
MNLGESVLAKTNCGMYEKNQWSPNNLNGKKQYSRKFLLSLRYSPGSLIQPKDLPQNFVIASSRKSKELSPQLNVYKDNTIPHKIINLDKEVNLSQSKNPWRPSKFKHTDKNVEDDIIQKTRCILNKLTVQKMDILINRFNELNIDTENKLKICINLIFEKAVHEPEFSFAYAGMCEILQNKCTFDSKNFLNLILSHCRSEFELIFVDGYDVVTEVLKNPKIKHRYLGNIRFICELYKKKLMTTQNIYYCIRKFSECGNEISLESLCKILNTIGKDLENVNYSQENQYNFNMCFNEIYYIVENRLTSNRIRLLLKNVIDLQNNKWKPNN